MSTSDTKKDMLEGQVLQADGKYQTRFKDEALTFPDDTLMFLWVNDTNVLCVRGSGELWVVGYNSEGSLGLGVRNSGLSKLTKVEIESTRIVKAVQGNMVLSDGGSILYAGDTQLGFSSGKVLKFTQINGLPKIVQLSCEDLHASMALALDEKGMVYSAAASSARYTGRGGKADGFQQITQDMDGDLLPKMSQVQAMGEQCLLLSNTGEVFAFGFYITLSGSPMSLEYPRKFDLPLAAGDKIIKIISSTSRALFLTEQGGVLQYDRFKSNGPVKIGQSLGSIQHVSIEHFGSSHSFIVLTNKEYHSFIHTTGHQN